MVPPNMKFCKLDYTILEDNILHLYSELNFVDIKTLKFPMCNPHQCQHAVDGPTHLCPLPPIHFPIVLIALVSRRYLELLVQPVPSPSRTLSSLAILEGLHLITYHESHLRSSAYSYGPLSLLRF